MTNVEKKVTVAPVQRSILFEGRILADVNPSASIEDVLKIHAMTTPELATAVLEGPELKEDGTRVYTAKKRLGTKG